jgi:hypothetical protein
MVVIFSSDFKTVMSSLASKKFQGCFALKIAFLNYNISALKPPNFISFSILQ